VCRTTDGHESLQQALYHHISGQLNALMQFSLATGLR
jgi:hypothetical protein